MALVPAYADGIGRCRCLNVNRSRCKRMANYPNFMCWQHQSCGRAVVDVFPQQHNDQDYDELIRAIEAKSKQIIGCINNLIAS